MRSARLILLGLAVGLLYGCTAWSPQGEPQTGNMVTLPATVICLLSACDTVLSDREEASAGSIFDEEKIEAKQTAESAPSLSIPAPGGGL